MIAKIADRRKAEGFTLIELLVVIVILVALAAIAIPVFLNQKASADDAADKSTVASLASFVSAGIANGSIDLAGLPTTVASEQGTMATNGASVTADKVAGTFCVEAASGNWHYSDTTGSVVSGGC